MCGIVGYIGGKAALDVVVEGLRRLEYRGYDSAGVAIVADETLHVAKKAGKLGNLEKLLGEEELPSSGLGIGHTRWATHGGPNDVNAIRIHLRHREVTTRCDCLRAVANHLAALEQTRDVRMSLVTLKLRVRIDQRIFVIESGDVADIQHAILHAVDPATAVCR